MYPTYIKRALDLFLSLLSLAVLSLPMAIIAAIVRLELGPPVIFKQKRIGKGEKEFLLFKFRTMTEARDERGMYLPDPERLTPFGRFLRIMSLDELPSLVNVVKGEMSIIGPRPLPVRYLSRYTKAQRRRHEVRPGLSGIAVIHGRNAQPWEEQFAKDIWYVDHMSLRVDLKCIFQTLIIIFTREGVTSEDGGARYEFIGNANITKLADHDSNYMKIRS